MNCYKHELVKENALLSVCYKHVITPSMMIPAHWHEYIEIIYLIQGQMNAVIQAKSYHANAGDILVINSNHIHMTETCGKQAEYILLQIPAKQMQPLFPNFETLQFSTVISERTHASTIQLLKCCILEMSSAYESTSDGFQLLFTAKLFEFLYHLYCNCSSWCHESVINYNTRDFNRITYIMEWIRMNYHRPITLEEAARQLNLSKGYFCRVFKTYTGQTFLEYLNTVRTIQLYEDLKKSDDSITNLMSQNGITNYKAFMRMFKMEYGGTPQAIRKSLQRGNIDLTSAHV